MSWPNCARRWAKFRLYPIIGDHLVQLRGGAFVSIGGGEDCAVGGAGEQLVEAKLIGKFWLNDSRGLDSSFGFPRR
jgi:hypothetical protein